VWSFETDLSRSHGTSQQQATRGWVGSKKCDLGRRSRAAGKDEDPVEVVGGLVQWNECVVPQSRGVDKGSKSQCKLARKANHKRRH